MTVGGTVYAQAPEWPYGQPTGSIDFETLVINEYNRNTTNTCQFTARGFTPSVGQAVVVCLGWKDNPDRLFGGVITRVEQFYVGTPDAQAFHVSCSDWRWLLNRTLVFERYTGQTATAIAQDIIATYAEGFSSADVAAGLATVTEITFDGVPVMEAIEQLADRIDGIAYAGYNRSIHLAKSETAASPADLTAAHPSLTEFGLTTDLGLARTRVVVTGGGGHATAAAAVGATSITVDAIGWYQALGGTLRSGPQRITYTGVSGNNITGIPAAGAGSIQYAIKVGDPVNIVAQVDDTSAQTALSDYLASGGRILA